MCYHLTRPRRADCAAASGTTEVPTTTQQRLPSWQPAGVTEAVAVGLAQNDMVKKLNAQQVACAADAFGESNIVLAGRRIARRMVVHQDNRRCILEDGGFKNLARLCFHVRYVVASELACAAP